MTDDDLETVRDIYAEGVATRNATFETKVARRPQAGRKWLPGHTLGRRARRRRRRLGRRRAGQRPRLLRRRRRDQRLRHRDRARPRRRQVPAPPPGHRGRRRRPVDAADLDLPREPRLHRPAPLRRLPHPRRTPADREARRRLARHRAPRAPSRTRLIRPRQRGDGQSVNRRQDWCGRRRRPAEPCGTAAFVIRASISTHRVSGSPSRLVSTETTAASTARRAAPWRTSQAMGVRRPGASRRVANHIHRFIVRLRRRLRPVAANWQAASTTRQSVPRSRPLARLRAGTNSTRQARVVSLRASLMSWAARASVGFVHAGESVHGSPAATLTASITHIPSCGP